MLKMKKGCIVPNSCDLSEQYSISDNIITANVNTNKIIEILKRFISMQKCELFFILELPTNQNDEIVLRKDDTSPMHIDVYYIDGLTTERAMDLLSDYGELLINDGLCRFGFGFHDNSAEIMSMPYNIVYIYTNNIDKYIALFEEQNIPQTEKCTTAWDTFSSDSPGRCRIIKENGKGIYDLPEELSSWGIYFAERREK